MTEQTDHRLDALSTWLSAQPEYAGLPLTPASGDASFRRYFRLSRASASWIVMDAPPPMEDCRPFVEVAGLLRAMSLNVPEIIAADMKHGFLLMTDLGSIQYLDVLRSDVTAADDIYADAISALLTIISCGKAHLEELPDYDALRLQNEMSLFRDWLCERHLGIRFSKREEREWRQACALLVDSALRQPQVFVHRDYHSRNLMLTGANNPGILDFQDALAGPLSYDIASLLKDCYFSLPAGDVRKYAMHFFSKLDDELTRELDEQSFWRCFELMGVQRHLKASGIFARLLHRDGKDGYMPDVPRTLRYIAEATPAYPELAFLRELIEERCLPLLEDLP